MPSDHFSEVRDELVEITEKLFRKLDLVDGLITIQYIVKDGKPYVIETMRRCLGNRFLTPVTAVTGFPFHKALVMAELGMDCSGLKAEEPMAKYAGHHAIMAERNGKYMGTEIPDDITCESDLITEIMKGTKFECGGTNYTGTTKEKIGKVNTVLVHSFWVYNKLGGLSKAFQRNTKMKKGFVEHVQNPIRKERTNKVIKKEDKL